MFSFFFAAEVDSSNIGIIELNWEDVHLEDVFVDLFESVDEIFFKLFFRLSFWLAQSLGDKWKEGVIFFVVEEKLDSGFSSFDETLSQLFIDLIGGFWVFKFNKSTGRYFGGGCFVLSDTLVNFFSFDQAWDMLDFGVGWKFF